jgi:hypothetical protein
MNSVNIEKTQRQNSDTKFYVYYNEWTGEIVSTGRSLRKDVNFPYITTSNTLARQILNGRINHRNYMVTFSDTVDNLDVVKKDNVLRLRNQEQALFLVPNTRKDKWDIRAKFYTVNHKMTVEINPDSVRQLANFTVRSQLRVENARNLNLYLVRRNQPDYLIEVFEVDPLDLIQNEILSIDISSIVKHTSYDNMTLLTRRNFENYHSEVLNTKYLPREKAAGLARSNTIHVAKDYADSHIAFEQADDRLLVSSSIDAKNFADHGLHQQYETFYVVGKTPDEFIGQIDVDATRLRKEGIEHFEMNGLDINDYNIIHRNDRIRVAKRKIL